MIVTAYQQITNEDSKVASGYIFGGTVENTRQFQKSYDEIDKMVLKSKDIYQLLQERDYSYR